jgi:hypothetical protein
MMSGCGSGRAAAVAAAQQLVQHIEHAAGHQPVDGDADGVPVPDRVVRAPFHLRDGEGEVLVAQPQRHLCQPPPALDHRFIRPPRPAPPNDLLLTVGKALTAGKLESAATQLSHRERKERTHMFQYTCHGSTISIRGLELPESQIRSSKPLAPIEL